MSTETSPEYSDRDIEAFLRLTLLIAAGAIAFASLLMTIANILVVASVMMYMGTATIFVVSSFAFFASWRKQRKLGAGLLVYGNHVLLAMSLVVVPEFPDFRPNGFITFALLAAFLIGPRHALIISGTGFPAYIVGMSMLHARGEIAASDMPQIIAIAVHIVVMTLLFFFLSRRFGQTVNALGARLLYHTDIFSRLPMAANELGAASSQLAETTTQHSDGAVRQSAAVSETLETLRSIHDASDEIVSSSKNTSENAMKTLANSEAVAAQLQRLTTYHQRISELLYTIAQVARRTELLALNAALEGTKAGQAGKGFQLVASQMQSLAERVADAVRNIGALTGEIQRESTKTQLSMEDMTKLARATTNDTQHIHLIVAQQQSSVRQVMSAMQDIADITSQVAEGSEQATRSTQDLSQLAEQLSTLVDKFAAGSPDAVHTIKVAGPR